MDIILINANIIILLTVSLLFVIVGLVKINTKLTAKKYSILKVKQLGGGQITEKELKFLNKNYKKNTIYMSGKTNPKFSWKKYKKDIILFFAKLSPFYKYKQEIETLQSDLKYSKMSASGLEMHVIALNDDIKALKNIITPPAKPVVEKKKEITLKDYAYAAPISKFA